MKKINWDKYKIRCSSLPTLMTASRSKSDPLSETAKSYLREIWIKEVFGREKYDKANKYTDKGISCESDALDLIKTVYGQTYFKNKKSLENDFIIGTPDVIRDVSVTDIKCSWDLWTFASVDHDKAEKDYYYQLAGYMWLSSRTFGYLIYCLVNTPIEIIQNELYKLSFRYPEIGTSDEADEKFTKNFVFDDIKPINKIKRFDFVIGDENIEAIKDKVIQCREYLKKIKL